MFYRLVLCFFKGDAYFKILSIIGNESGEYLLAPAYELMRQLFTHRINLIQLWICIWMILFQHATQLMDIMAMKILWNWPGGWE